MSKTIHVSLTNGLLTTLGLIGILGPFGTDIYLPAMPQMANALRTSPAGIQLAITGFTVGMALGQLVMGSASDRIGRKKLLVAGTGLMFLASFLASLTDTLWLLVGYCVLMGISAAAGMVCGRAIISDLAEGKAASRGFSLMGLVAGLGSIIAPIGGALILGFSDWRGIFIALGILAAVLTLWAVLAIPETLTPENRHSGGFSQLLKSVGGIMRNRNFMLHATILWAGFGMMFAYISASPFVVEGIFGLSPFAYTLDFGANGVGLLVTGYLSAALVNKVEPARQIRIGVGMQVLAAAIMVAVFVTGFVNPVPVFAAFMLLPSSLGFIFGPVTALGLKEVRNASGTALALMGSIQFFVAGIAAVLVGLAGPVSIAPLCGVLAILAVVGLLSLAAVERLRPTF